MRRPVIIGNAQGFWGDNPLAAFQLASKRADLDYLTLDYLAEVSLSIMAVQKQKDPSAGYAYDFLEVLNSLAPLWKQGSSLKVVTNAGGLNPIACGKACKKLLEELGLPHLQIAVVDGDDVLDKLKADPKNPAFRNLETSEPLETILDNLVTANAYLGAMPIADALQKGASIVITGRVADPSLTVGPCIHHFSWERNAYARIAGATIAGHVIECGTQATGGVSTHWMDLPGKELFGFPIVEIEEDGSFTVTKPPGTGGEVSERTVKEQLLYEIGDPAHYLSPDVTVSFLELTVKQAGENRVKVSGAIGSPPPATYKVSATYRDGYKAEGMIAITGPQALDKAQICGEIVLAHTQQAGYKLDRTCIEKIGDSMGCMLRVAAADSRKEAVEAFSKQIAPLVTCGPQGVTGYTTGRPSIRPVFGYWPCLIPRNLIKSEISCNLSSCCE